MPRPGNFSIGCDLGLVYDYTAIAVVERLQQLRAIPMGDKVREDVHHVTFLHRWPHDTPYRQVIDDMGKMMQKADLRDAVIILDGTGVGKEVTQLFWQAFREQRLGHYWPRSYVITGGREITSEVVPKRELIGKLLTLLESNRLLIADELELAPILKREFLQMRVKTTPLGHDSFESARERDHDDIVLAVALACWYRHNLTTARLIADPEEARTHGRQR